MPTRLRDWPAPSVAIVALALTLASCGDESKDALRPRRPAESVVVLTFDAMRADALGVYGNPRVTSPALDAFAADAWLYEHAYSPAPLTSASFAAMFTGRYQRKSASGWRIETGTTIAEVFSGLGFRTAAFVANYWLLPSRGFARGFGRYYLHPDDETVLARALAWAKGQRGHPFLLWIHLIDPHIPWVRQPEAQHLYDPGYRGEFLERVPPLVRIDDAGALARAKDLYAGEVFHVDRLFRRFWRTLGRLGLRDRVAVVVSSDHGEELMEHGMLQHGQLTDENLHVPLLIRPPGGGRGRRIPTAVGTIDLLPTLLDLVGRQAPAVAVERSLLGAPRGSQPLFALAEGHAVAARVGTLKLIVRCDGSPGRQLFDLKADPTERYDLAGARADAVRDIERLTWHALGVESCSDFAAPADARLPHDKRLDPETRRALEALGYVEPDAH